MLSDKIWITRKTRIYAEKRLQEYAFFSEFSMILFSLALVSLSVWGLENSSERNNLLQIFISTVALVLSVFLTSQKFTERSITMRNCYIKLDEIYSKVKRAEEKNDIDMIQQLELEYTGILLNIENHTDYDYLCLRFSLKNNPNTTLPQFTSFDYFSYIWQTTCWIIFKIIIVLTPAILAITIWM